MDVWVYAVPTEYGNQIGKKDFKINDVYDLGFLHDGTSHVVRCSRLKEKNYSERQYISLEDYVITIGINR